MLQNINLHLHPDAETQLLIEQNASRVIERNKRENFAYLKHAMPNVMTLVNEPSSGDYSVMCNQHGEFNLVDYASGTAFYGQNPDDEIKQHLSQFFDMPLYISLSDDAPASASVKRQVLDGLVDSPLADAMRDSLPFAQHSAVLVSLGVGLGYHIKSLVARDDVDHLIIYEPNIDIFKCSLLTSNWRDIFSLAKKHNTAVYLQLGDDGSNLYQDMGELAAQVEFNGVYVYQHYHIPIFDELVNRLCRDSWRQFCQWVPTKENAPSIVDYVPPWAPPVDLTHWKTDYLQSTRFQKNLTAFREYFPEIFSTFSNYSPLNWQPLANELGEVNVFHRHTLSPLYSDTPIKDGERLFANYQKHPNTNNLTILSSGGKLGWYHHFQFIGEVAPALEVIEESEGNLPDSLETLIMFGIGGGHQLVPLTSSRKVESLFICEPNSDLFYASLYAIDWKEILDDFDRNDGRIYINVGDDGSNLANDLMVKFSRLGSHLLSNAYVFRGQFNKLLDKAYSGLREKLRQLATMQGSFDGSRYALNQTIENVNNHAYFLLANADQRLAWRDKEVPVFIVGNGPSLDKLFPLLKENADKAIVVSCGTALQSLYSHGITPDFHAEVEVNRAPCDWVGRIGDPEYLKKIRLVGWSAIHPDLAAMFKSCHLTLKAGEAPTTAIATINDQLPLAALIYTYPTVSNLAASFVCQFGFKECYLFGTDLGFVDDNHHHSKSSGYYLEGGKELLEYNKIYHTQLQVEGNFRPLVFTKHEFKMSCEMLGKVFRASPGTVYNLNDGAKIDGTHALLPENMLVTTTLEQKSATLNSLIASCFVSFIPSDFNRRVEALSPAEKTIEAFEKLRRIANQTEVNAKTANTVIEAHYALLNNDTEGDYDVFWLLMSSTLGLTNCMLNKAQVVTEPEQRNQTVSAILTGWSHFLLQATESLKQDPGALDCTASHAEHRKALRYRQLRAENVLGEIEVVPSHATRHMEHILPDNLPAPQANSAPVKIQFYLRDDIPPQSDVSCYITCDKKSLNDLREKVSQPIVYAPGSFENSKYSVACNPLSQLKCALEASLNGLRNTIIIPKLILDPVEQRIEDHYDISIAEGYYSYDCSEYLVLTEGWLPNQRRVTEMGDRLRYIPVLSPKYFVYEEQTLLQQDKERARLKGILFTGNENV